MALTPADNWEDQEPDDEVIVGDLDGAALQAALFGSDIALLQQVGVKDDDLAIELDQSPTERRPGAVSLGFVGSSTPWLPTADGVLASIYADFANQFYFSGAKNNSFAEWLAALGGTFTGSANGTFVNSAGLITQATANIPRFDYDPVTLLPKGILLEGARTNLTKSSQTLNGADWTTDGSASLSQITGPDNISSITTFTEDTNTTRHRIYNNTSITISSGGTYTISAYLEAGTRQYVNIGLRGNAIGSEFSVTVDTVGWTVSGTNSAAAGTYISSTLQNVGGGFYRVTVTGICGVETAAFTIISGSNGATGNTALSYLGNGSTFSAGLAQLELGTFASSYIPTTTVAVTRAADFLSPNKANFSTMAGALIANVSTEFGVGTPPVNQYIFSADGDPWLYNASASGGVLRTTGGASPVISTGNAFVVGLNKAGVTWGASSRALCLNAGTVVSDANPIGVLTTTAAIGSNNVAGSNLFGWMTSFTYFNGITISNAELQRLTT